MTNDKAALRKIIEDIIREYEYAEEFCISQAYSDGGTENPFPRFNRAVMNQMDDGSATLSRYAIWANTVRDNIINAVKLMGEDPAGALEHLKVSVNSLSCFSEIQALFDPFEGGATNREPHKINVPKP